MCVILPVGVITRRQVGNWVRSYLHVFTRLSCAAVFPLQPCSRVLICETDLLRTLINTVCSMPPPHLNPPPPPPPPPPQVCHKPGWPGGGLPVLHL
jgi:hypothetical protein